MFSNERPNNWAKGSCHCQWTDVTCLDNNACSDSPVVKIDFTGTFDNYGMNVSGTLPVGSHFAVLSELQYLWLTGNPRLSGSLPESWANMTKMQQLYLKERDMR